MEQDENKNLRVNNTPKINIVQIILKKPRKRVEYYNMV